MVITYNFVFRFDGVLIVWHSLGIVTSVFILFTAKFLKWHVLLGPYNKVFGKIFDTAIDQLFETYVMHM
jgi:hypothetical protein